MKHKNILIGILCGMFLLALAGTEARAESTDAMTGITFPIAELGSCENKNACKAYCDDSANIEACVSFAEKNGLMSEKEVREAKKFIAAGAKGPGGCTSKASCEAYCDDIGNIDACVAYAEENDLMSGEELEEAKKIRAAIKNGVTPPACRSKEACDAFCENPDNMPACITFAKAAGLMSAEEQANAEKMLQALQSGVKPPACRGKEECDVYCSIESNFDECVTFAKAAGFMTDEEYEMAKKTRGKGPGGCRSKEACDAFCTSSPENENICINFQVDNGLISEERKKEMQEDGNRFRQSFSNMPPQVESCLKDAWGADNYEKLKAGTMRLSRGLGDAMSTCFGKFEQERMQNDRPSGPPPQDSSEQSSYGPPPSGEGQYTGPRPGEMYRCEGENCRPPEGFIPPQEGQYMRPPAEPMTPSPTTESSAEPVPSAPQTEPVAPPAETTPAISPESFSGAVILFFKSLRS